MAKGYKKRYVYDRSRAARLQSARRRAIARRARTRMAYQAIAARTGIPTSRVGQMVYRGSRVFARARARRVSAAQRIQRWYRANRGRFAVKRAQRLARWIRRT